MNRILAFALLAVLITSCHKTVDDDRLITPQQSANEDTAGLQQNIYKVNVYKETVRSLILLSPYLPSQQDKGRVMIFNEKGVLVKQKETGGAAFCFRRWVIAGKVRYTYIVNDVTALHLPGQLTGYAVIADENLNEIKKVHLLPHKDIVTGPGYVDLDVHDFILLSDEHYITMSYYPKAVSNIPADLSPHPNVKVVANIIQEIRNGEVVWQWDGTDYPEFYTTSAEGNKYTDSVAAQDYMHMNSMITDPRDNSLICSFRNTDQVLKIERGTGKIIWRLGGRNSNFPLSATQTFLRQHNATLIDDNNTLLLFDNGVSSSRTRSRILEFKLNEATRMVQGFKLYDIPAPFSQFMGSVQKTKAGNYFIGGGTGNYAMEINPATGERFIEFIGDRASYRAYKYEVE